MPPGLPARPQANADRLAVHEAICAPDLEGALANAVFEALIHVNV